jgi:hypothetical protein
MKTRWFKLFIAGCTALSVVSVIGAQFIPEGSPTRSDERGHPVCIGFVNCISLSDEGYDRYRNCYTRLTATNFALNKGVSDGEITRHCLDKATRGAASIFLPQ